jgi:hypothetical protein
MDARGLDLDLLESRRRQLVFVIILIQRAGNAAYPGQNIFPNLGQDLAAGHHVGNGEPASRLKNSIGLAQNSVFVRREIDNAVRYDDVDRVIRQRNVFDLAFQKFDIFNSRLALVLVCESDHFIGHIQTISFAGWANTPRREQDINATA